MRRLPEYIYGLTWLVGLKCPELNELVSQILNRPEHVWTQWLTTHTHLHRELRGKLSFLLSQAVLVPGLRISTGVNPLIAWRHYCRVHRQRYPVPLMIGTRIVLDMDGKEQFDELSNALLWYWLLEMGYPVALPYFLCHPRIILGLHLVREHVTIDHAKLKLGCDDDMLTRMLGGHVVLSLIGAFKVMALNTELAAAHPLTTPNRADKLAPLR